MAAEHRRRRKTHLDQHVKDVSGDYHYIGDWYAPAGGSKTLQPFLILTFLLIAAVIGSGCVNTPGLRDTWYVILPFLLEAALLFFLVWRAIKLLTRDARLKAYDYERVVPGLPQLLSAQCAAALLAGLCAGVEIALHGMNGQTAENVLYLLLKAAAAALALLSRRSIQSVTWVRESATGPAT